MNELIKKSELLNKISDYEKELCEDRTVAIESDDEQMMFAIMNQETAICRIKKNILHILTIYNVDKVVEEVRCRCYEMGLDESQTEIIVSEIIK